MPQSDYGSETGHNLEFDDGVNKSSLDNFLDSNKLQIAGILIGLTLIGFGVFLYRQGYFRENSKIEIIETTAEEPDLQMEITVEVSGAIQNPGVYELPEGARVEDLLIASGGVSADADRAWMEKFINRAAKLSDGQKVYIYKTGEQSENVSARNDEGIKMDQQVMAVGEVRLVNINTASFSQLDALPGIGQVYGQSIIEHRPYSTIDELVKRGVLKQSVYDKIKDLITVF